MKTLVLALALTLSILESGCATRAPLTPAQTIQLDLNQAIASVAATNKAMATSVMALADSKAIDVKTANAVLNYNRQVAQAVIAAEQIQSSNVADKLAAVKTIMGALRLPTEVAALLTGSQGNQTVIGLINIITSLQSAIGTITGGH